MRHKWFLGFILALSFNMADSFARKYDDVKAHFFINGKDSNMLRPGMPNTVEVYFTKTDTKEVIKDFKIMHGKYMHMVVVNSKLSHFRHIHPYFDPVTGRFQITFNMPLADEDNFQVGDVIPGPGKYMIMADIEVKGIGMRMFHKMAMAHGESTFGNITLDTVNPDGSIVKYYTSEKGEEYKLVFNYNITEGSAGNLIEILFDAKKKNQQGEFVRSEQMTKWLATGAHALWISKKMMNKKGMSMAHTHARLPEVDSLFIFSHYDACELSKGIQKIWVQFKDNGAVHTIPFVFNYYGVNPELCASSTM